MQSHKEFEKGLSEEVRAAAKKMFDEMIAPYIDDEPMIIMSESDDDEKYVKVVDTIKKPAGE